MAAVWSASLASTICTSVENPSEVIPRNPLRNATRAFPSSAAGSASKKTKPPGTAHSPGSAARSKMNVSDGSSRMVRSSFMTSPRSPGAAQHEVVRCRPGVQNLESNLGPGSAVHRYALHRIRDTFRQITYCRSDGKPLKPIDE